MSDWSSFSDAKVITDAWRLFLREGILDDPAYSGLRYTQQKDQSAPDPSPDLTPTDPEEPEAPDEEESTGLDKSTPLSVTKKQKDVKAGAGGQTEQPLVMQLQKLGLSQSSAQQIAKRIGQYLQQRKIPVAEGVLSENAASVKKSIHGHLQKLNRESDPAYQKQGSEFILGLHNVAKSGNPEKFKAFITKRFKKGGDAETIANLSAEDIAALMQYATGNEAVRKRAKQAYDMRQARAQEKTQKRGELRGVGAEKGIIGKIISRFVSDNQQLLQKDNALQAIFADPVKFNKLRKAVTTSLKRQLKRRGYEDAELAKLLEHTIYTELHRCLHE